MGSPVIGKKRLHKYTLNFNIIQNLSANETFNLRNNMFYLLKDSYTIVNGISNMKTEKTMALIELLDHTRLISPGELMKMGK